MADALERAKTAPLADLLEALGVPRWLRPRHRSAITKRLPAIENVLSVSVDDLVRALSDDGLTLPDEYDARAFLDWSRDAWTRSVVDAWQAAGVVMDDTDHRVRPRIERRLRVERDAVQRRGRDWERTEGRHQLSTEPASDSEPAEAESVVVPDRLSGAAALWNQILVAHPARDRIGRRGRLPARNIPGCLYMYWPKQGELVAVAARSLAEAWGEVSTSTDLESRGVKASREEAIWVSGTLGALRRTSPMLTITGRSVNALDKGRPILIRSDADWVKAPIGPGIYRIHRLDENGHPEVYVGRTGNFRARPRRHEKVAGLTWGGTPGLLQIELIRVKASGAFDSADLDEAEKMHVDRARHRALKGGPKVLND